MKFTHPLLQKAIGFGLTCTARVLRRTIDWRAVYFDPTIDTAHTHHTGRFIYLCWHECLVMPVALHGDQRMVALASGHRDGVLIGRIMRALGWNVVHGSSTRGGTAAVMRLLRDDTRHISISPDGPRGPRRTMAAGAVFLASRLGLPIVCVGYGYDRPWRMKSWDRFAVPRPFTRGRAMFGPPLSVPPGADREELERYRLWFEGLLSWLTEEAERWATEGGRRPGEVRHLPHRAARSVRVPLAPSAPPMPTQLADAWAALTTRKPAAA